MVGVHEALLIDILSISIRYVLDVEPSLHQIFVLLDFKVNFVFFFYLFAAKLLLIKINYFGNYLCFGYFS